MLTIRSLKFIFKILLNVSLINSLSSTLKSSKFSLFELLNVHLSENNYRRDIKIIT